MPRKQSDKTTKALAETYGAGTRFADKKGLGTEVSPGVVQLSGPLPEALMNPSAVKTVEKGSKDNGTTGNGANTGEGSTPVTSKSNVSTPSLAASEAASPNA